MQNLTIRRTSDLTPSDRESAEALLGRELADDEQVGIWASRPHAAPTGGERDRVWGRLNDHLKRMASKVSPGTVEDLEHLVDEESSDVRHGRS